jgi:hypothetical protein
MPLIGYAVLILLSQMPSPGVQPVEKPKSASSTQQTKTESPDTKPPKVVALKTAEDRIADYTLLLFGVTAGLLVVAFRQDRQIRREFFSTHRPKLRIRQIEYVPDEVGGGAISAVVANVGRSTAKIVEVLGSEWVGWGGNQPLPARAIRPPMVAATVHHPTLKTGETTVLTYRSGELESNYNRHTSPTPGTGAHETALMFYCTIRYADGTGVERMTSVYETLNISPPFNGFTPVPNQPDYNYED